MGDENAGDTDALQERSQFSSHLLADLEIKVAQWFIKKEVLLDDKICFLQERFFVADLR